MPDANSYVRFGTHNMVLPPEGPKVYPLTLDFRLTNTQTLDFVAIIMQKQITFLQGVFVDNSLNMNPLFIETDQVGQRVQIPAQSQAYMPLMITDSAVIDFTTVQAGNLLVPVIMTNCPVMPYIWSIA